jgi:hypothetical protein
MNRRLAVPAIDRSSPGRTVSYGRAGHRQDDRQTGLGFLLRMMDRVPASHWC